MRPKYVGRKLRVLRPFSSGVGEAFFDNFHLDNMAASI